jgi:hypothetical protein
MGTSSGPCRSPRRATRANSARSPWRVWVSMKARNGWLPLSKLLH